MMRATLTLGRSKQEGTLMSRKSKLFLAHTVAAILLATAPTRAAAIISCGSESGTGEITVTQAFQTLYLAVHTNVLHPPPTIWDLAIHDADGSLQITAVDALLFLRAAVELPVDLRCYVLVEARVEAEVGFNALQVDIATSDGDCGGIVVVRDPNTDVLVPQCESLYGDLYAFDYEELADEFNTINVLRYGAVSLEAQMWPRSVLACLMRADWEETTFVYRSQAWGFDEEAGLPIDHGTVPIALQRY